MIAWPTNNIKKYEGQFHNCCHVCQNFCFLPRGLLLADKGLTGP